MLNALLVTLATFALGLSVPVADSMFRLSDEWVSRVSLSRPGTGDKVYETDMAFALDELGGQCGALLKVKDIDWKEVDKQFRKEAKKVKDDEQFWVLLTRLLARLNDGHCRVEPYDHVPDSWKVEQKGPGFFLCKVGKNYYTKNVWSTAEGVGLKPGMQVLSLDGLPIKKWMAARLLEIRDRRSFSTDQHAQFWVLNRGFSKDKGERLKLEFKDAKGKRRKRTISLDRASAVPNGPAFVPKEYKSLGDSVRYGITERGYGYIHFRRVKGDILKELDQALAELGDVPGMILDFRGNSGGGCDHDALEARFVPKDGSMPRMARSSLKSAGEHPYGGPMVVIVDATTVSAGETTSGMFKEDGRAYMIGESATAGMSSQKTTIELPSGKFKLYVSIRSNRSSFNGGRGIEGIGVPPDELVSFSPDELAAGVDSITRRAGDLLARFPQKEVAYDPAKYGWQPN